ncbi:hypothetical protein ACEE99_24510 [Cytobacillus pseudoceanisediminis]
MGLSNNNGPVLNEILNELKKLNEKVDALTRHKDEEKLRKQLADAANKSLNA